MRVRSIARVAAALPPAGAELAAWIAAPLLPLLSPSKARAWQSNARRVAPTSTRVPSVGVIAPFRHHLLLLYESLAMVGGRKFMVEREGEESLHAALAEGRGVLVVTAHLGNWHLGARELHEETGRTIHSVAAVQMLRGWTDDLRGAYRSLGLEVHAREGSSSRFAQILRRGGIVALHLDGDQHGARGPATRGAALLSRRTGCPVLPAVCERKGPGRFVVRFGRALAGGRSAPDPERLSDLLIEMVRGRTDQWALFRPLWACR
jgi:lauroyl/myristoyl acyltransferase